MNPLLGLLQLLAIGFAVSIVGLIVHTAYMLTHPNRRTYAWAVSRRQPGDPGELDEPLAFESREINTEHGQIHIWDIEGRDPNGPIVLMTHGWGSSRQGSLKRLSAIADDVSSIIAWDLPGHGEAPGSARMGCDEHRIGADLLDALGDPGRALFLFGWSMGAGVSLALCAQTQNLYPVHGVICEALYNRPITPARAVLALRGMPHRLNLAPAMSLLGIKLGVGPRWRGFDRDQIASAISVPILLLHGDHDPVSPLEDAKMVQHAAPNAELCVIEGGGHNNLWVDPIYRAQSRDAVVGFMKRCSAPAPHTATHAQP
ncbi:MAG: alpha/beta fold hydrolase [Phycisphaerales bacterium JB047]